MNPYESMSQVEKILALAHSGWTAGKIAQVLKIPVQQVVGITRNGI